MNDAHVRRVRARVLELLAAEPLDAGEFSKECEELSDVDLRLVNAAIRLVSIPEAVTFLRKQWRTL